VHPAEPERKYNKTKKPVLTFVRTGKQKAREVRA